MGDLTDKINAQLDDDQPAYSKGGCGYPCGYDCNGACFQADPTPSDGLREALVNLEKAASEVSRYGAQTGPQWSRLSIALLKARSALSALTEQTKENPK